MNWFGRLRPDDVGAGNAELAEKTAATAAEESLRELGDDLLAAVEAVTPAEFGWQEAHYEHDSRQGRELLFLMANYEWVRATSEMVDIRRSDTIETTIKIDVDLGQVTHEAFRKRTGPIWLPVAILPPYIRRDDPTAPPEADRSPREPDLFTTVTDATGKPVPMMPAADLQHQISAAMAEIIAKMAVSYRPPEPNQEQPVATRDQRLLLSAAIYRVLRQRSDQAQPGGGDEDARQATSASAIDSPRLTEARTKLAKIVGYFDPLISAAGDRDARARLATDDALPAALARRAVKVLLALRESLIVVVLMNYDLAPSVLSVRVPPRGLKVSSASLLKPRTWIVRPAGRLEIAVLLATADADRQIQVFRWQDRPGATMNVLTAIGTALRETLPAIDGQDWSVSYARLQVITGQVAIARMTLRLHVPWQSVDHWTPDYVEETARKIEYLAAGAAAKQAAQAAGRAPEAAPDVLRTPEEPVVRIDRIRKI
jgi:hypothetical protein